MVRGSRDRRLGRLAIVAVAALTPALASCEAGLNAPTQQWHQPTDGAGTWFRQIAIRNLFVLGPPDGGVIPAGHSASLFFALVNNGPADRLTSISAPGVAHAVILPGGGINLPSGGSAFLTGPAPKAVLSGLTRPLTAGSNITLYLTFANAGTVRLQVPVVPRTSYFVTLSPPASASPGPVRHHHHHPAAAPSPSPSSSP
jgi:copper(I)-binding protein